VFHFLLEHHKEIRRTVKTLPNGVETVTESDREEVAKKIQDHVPAMVERLKKTRPVRMWDPLFAEMFRHGEQVKTTVEKTARGVKVVATSSDPRVVRLVQAHAGVVSKFVERGFAEAHEAHEVPGESKERKGSALQFPIIEGYGGVIEAPDAVEAPRKGMKVVFDVTAEDANPSKPLPGLIRAAVLLNLAGQVGLKANDLELVVVVHGAAASAVLDDQAYQVRTDRRHPHGDLLQKLSKAGVRLLVCAQTLERQKLDRTRLRSEVKVAASAVSAVVNLQAKGFAYVPSH
jgi:intracellular sulfur oxidation DsrE/DsrF family protein